MSALYRNLTTAIHFGDIKAVKKLLKSSKQKPLCKNPFIFGGYRLLKLAIGLKRKDIAKLLINVGARVNPKYKKTLCSPLHHAVGKNYLDIVELLVKKGADINKKVGGFSSPLVFAVSKEPAIKLPKRLEVMKYLLRNGADTEVEVEDDLFLGGLIALYGTCHQLNFKQAKLLLKYNANVNTKLKYFNTFVTAEIVLRNDIKLMSVLLNHGAKPNYIITKNFIEHRISSGSYVRRRLESFGQSTLLHLAIVCDEADMVELLIQHGADIHCRTEIFNRTPLMIAIEEYNPSIVELLLKNGAKVDEYDEAGISPLHYVISNPNNFDILYTPEMLFGFEREKVEITQLLLDAGANINEALEPLGTRLTFISAAATYGQSSILYLAVLDSDLDCSLIDYNILQKARLDIGLLPLEIVNDPDNLKLVKNLYRQSEINLLKGIIKNHFRSIFKSQSKGIDEELLAAIEAKPVNKFVSRDEHIKDIIDMADFVKWSISSMNKQKVGDSNISLWNLLTSPWDSLINHAYNKDVRKLCSEDYRKYIPYFHELQSRLDAAIKRSRLLEKSVEIAFVLFKLLPLDCCGKVMGFFTNNELETFNDQFNEII